MKLDVVQKQLEADRLVCMPALSDHMKIEIDESEKNAQAYMLAIPTSTNKSQKAKLSQKTTIASAHDMCSYCVIPFDMSQYTFYLHVPQFLLRVHGPKPKDEYNE